jgi:CubicO group peptidase (beta-lactamase class C family)
MFRPLGLLAAVVVLCSAGCGVRNAERADDLDARLEQAVDRFLSTHTVPGASVAVMVDGRLFEAVSGVADVATGRKVTVDTTFRIASMTKTYVAALALDLAEDGVVSLDDRVQRWLPRLPESLAFVREVTLRQLLSHTSGLAQTFTADRDRGRVLTSDDLLARIPPPVCEPGTCWSYADGNYILVGLVLEAATGRPLSTGLNARLLRPFDLTRTRLLNAAALSKPTPLQYDLLADDGAEPVTAHRLRRQLLPISAENGAGGMIAAASDVARWADALFTGRVVEKTSLKEMLDSGAMRGLPCPEGCPSPYGLGVFHYMVADHELIGHDGSSGTVVAHDQGRRLTVAILTNGGERDMGTFLRVVLGAVDDRGD